MGKLLSSEIAPRKLIISVAEPLHFDSCITRFIKSGSNVQLRLPWGTYKLLRGYPPSPLLVTLISPSQNGEGFFLLFYLLSFKKIVFYFLVKVDGHVSRASRDKCPVHTESIPFIKN